MENLKYYTEAELKLQRENLLNDIDLKETIENAGDKCKCGGVLKKRIPKRKKLKPGQTYYFEAYLYCDLCNRMYMVEKWKIKI